MTSPGRSSGLGPGNRGCGAGARSPGGDRAGFLPGAPTSSSPSRTPRSPSAPDRWRPRPDRGRGHRGRGTSERPGHQRRARLPCGRRKADEDEGAHQLPGPRADQLGALRRRAPADQAPSSTSSRSVPAVERRSGGWLLGEPGRSGSRVGGTALGGRAARDHRTRRRNQCVPDRLHRSIGCGDRLRRSAAAVDECARGLGRNRRAATEVSGNHEEGPVNSAI